MVSATRKTSHFPLPSDVCADAYGMADPLWLRVLSFPEVAAITDLSIPTLERADDLPVTKLSARRKGVRLDHLRAWLDARASKGNEWFDERAAEAAARRKARAAKSGEAA